MDSVKELFAEVLRDRIQQFSASPNDTESKLCSALGDATKYLADGVPIAINVLMGHSDCKASKQELCSATQRLEVLQ